MCRQGEPGSTGMSGLPGLPGEDGAPGQKVVFLNPLLYLHVSVCSDIKLTNT